MEIDGIQFLTDPKENLQIGIMRRPAGYKVKPHYHNNTQEVLYIIFGSVKIEFDGAKHIASKNDIIHLTEGVHSLEFLEDSRILEIKQGPHKNDKIYV